MFSERLKQLRQNNRYTQDLLAEKLGISRVAYTKYEGGKNMPTPDKLEKPADIFEVSVDYLLGRTDDPAPYKDVNADVEYPPELQKLISLAQKLPPDKLKTIIKLLEEFTI